MKLWTWQREGFQIDQDLVDLSHSHQLNNAPNQRPKYDAVHKRVGSDQLMWCFTIETEWNGNQTTVDHRVLWKLDVPTDQITCFVDEWLAHRLINEESCPDIDTWRSWRIEASKQHPGMPDHQNGFINCKLEQYSGPMLDPDDGWNGYFLDEVERCDSVSAVLRSPVCSDWITSRPITH